MLSAREACVLSLREIFRLLLDGLDMEPMVPWFRGFGGEVETMGPGKFSIAGVLTKLDETTLEVSELPIGQWTNTYTDFLSLMIEAAKPGARTPRSWIFP